MTTLKERIKDYVRRQGSCEPSEVRKVSEEGADLDVYRVDVESWYLWTVPPPPFWYVCVEPIMSLYRGDQLLVQPWKAAEDQDESAVADYVISFHLGLCLRLQEPSDK